MALQGTGGPMPAKMQFNTDFARDPMGYVNALGSNDPKMMFNAELAVKGDTIPAKTLVDIVQRIAMSLRNTSGRLLCRYASNTTGFP